MTRSIRRSAFGARTGACLRRAFLPLFLLACIALPHLAAYAEPAEGCDPRVLNAMQRVAQARVAYNKSVTDQIYDQDDSVLALTCFNQSAAIAAKQAGEIFSEDFSTPLQSVVNDALTSMYLNFGDSIGSKSGAVDYSAAESTMGDGSAPYDCAYPRQLWQAVNDSGINQEVPYVTFDDLRKGNATPLPAAYAPGTNFLASWNSPSSQSAFNNMDAAMTELETVRPAVPSFSGADTPCMVMKTLNPTLTCP